MNEQKPPVITPDPWEKLRNFTEARIALGRSGISLPLSESLKFKLAHARARDAVYQAVAREKLTKELTLSGQPILHLQSGAEDRTEYLARPDKGRVLAEESRLLLKQEDTGYNLCIVICDGLSAPAINSNGAAVCNGLLKIISPTSLTVGPVCLVKNGRVAIGDKIAMAIKSDMVITLIGERPGLSSPHSMGAYLTYKPKAETTDEARNCISNIRPGGLTVAQAVTKIAYLIEHAFQLEKTGIELKDRMSSDFIPFLSYQK